MKKKRILIVDDEVSFTRLLKLNLEQTDDYEVKIETNWERVVKAAREFRPDLILLDVVMPGMFGNEVADRLRADAEVRSTPVVFLSAALGKKSIQANHGGIDGYPFIAKPACLNEIVVGIENSLIARGGPVCQHGVLRPETDSTGVIQPGTTSAVPELSWTGRPRAAST